jgi:hypothetical protein
MQKPSSGRILESIEKEEDKEARILAEAMTSVPEVDDDELELSREDIQGFSEAERRSKSKKKGADIRYISLKPLWKKERKRQQKMISDTDEPERPPPDELDSPDESEEFVKPSPVPLPDPSTCKSILHKFGLHKKGNEPRKNIRYADGVLPGQGSPDHNAQDNSSPQSTLASSAR